MGTKQKQIIIIGAGPGGLTAGMILSHRGFNVKIFEKDTLVGGRNKPIQLDGYTFDTGPTFLNLSFILEEMFTEVGKKATDYLEFKPLDPFYSLVFYDKTIYPTTDRTRMREQISKLFPGNEQGLDRYYKTEEKRFRALFPCLQKDYSSLSAFIDPIFLKAMPQVGLGKSLMGNLAGYFNNEALQLCFTFQSKYLGMSPWKCPALFSILSFMEHFYGINHVTGGLNAISEAMAKVIKSSGGEINTGLAVKELIIKDKSVSGVILQDNTKVYSDDVIINADFAYAMTSLIPEGILKKYSAAKLERKKYSCSTFMIYLGVKKQYPLLHHNIFFAQNYRANVDDIFSTLKLSKDISFYVQNACVTDKTLAPQGKSTLYILVPVPNNFSNINWKEEKSGFREHVLDQVIRRAKLTDLRQNIEVEKVITPNDWEHDYNVYHAAEFNFAHNIPQMLYWRPHNKFEELDHCYLVGGGTHPGSGLPTIYESARITSNLLCKKYGIPFKRPSSLDEK